MCHPIPSNQFRLSCGLDFLVWPISRACMPDCAAPRAPFLYLSESTGECLPQRLPNITISYFFNVPTFLACPMEGLA